MTTVPTLRRTLITLISSTWYEGHRGELGPEHPCSLGRPGTHWSLLGAFLSWSAVTLQEKLKNRMAFSLSLSLLVSLSPPPLFSFHSSKHKYQVFTILQELSWALRLSPCEDRDLSFHWWGWFQYCPSFAEFPQVMSSLFPLELL